MKIRTLQALVAAFALGCSRPSESDYVQATVEKETWVNKSYIIELRMNDGKKYTKIVTDDHSTTEYCPYANNGYRPEKHVPLDFLDNVIQQGASLRVLKDALSRSRADGIGYLCTAAILIPDQPAVSNPPATDQPNVEKENK